MYAGYGAGRTCSGCKDTIGPKDVEYEADFPDAQRYYLHLRCAGLWHAVRLRREDAASVMEESQAIMEQAVTTRSTVQARHAAVWLMGMVSQPGATVEASG